MPTPRHARPPAPDPSASGAAEPGTQETRESTGGSGAPATGLRSGTHARSEVVEALPQTSREWIETLVSLDTTSSVSDRPVIDLLEAGLAAAGARTHIFSEDDDLRVNLVASFPATVASDSGESSPDPYAGGILLAGHADCVPTAGQTWQSDPLVATERGGRLYGRGTADMKSFLGIIAALAPELTTRPLAQPLHVAATFEEETTGNGARALVQQLRHLGIHPEIAYVGEPTGMRATTGHKSINVLKAHFRGKAIHSSLAPHGVNAVRYAAEFTEWYFREIIDRFAADGPFDDHYPVSFSTGGVHVFHGGNAMNTVPATADLDLEFRTLPGVDFLEILERIENHLAGEVTDRMQAEDPDARAWLERVSVLPALDSSPESTAARLAVKLGAVPHDGKVTYGTEAGIYSQAGMDAIVLGPGEIDQAHGPDEYIELDQIPRFEDFLRTLFGHVAETRDNG